MNENLTKKYMRESNQEFWDCPETRRGLELFQKKVAKINWFKLPQPNQYTTPKEPREGTFYVVVNEKGEEVLRAKKQKDVAEFLGTQASTVCNAIKKMQIIKGLMVYKEKTKND